MAAAPLKVGIAGLGRLGKRHAQALAFATRHCQLVSACSPVAAERDWAHTELGITTLHADFDAFVRDPQLDAVILVTPTALHADQTIAALEAGKHVFVEKPLALNVPDCERVEAVARQHPKQVAMVGFVRRFDPSYANAKAQIDAGGIGKPFLVRSQTADMNDPSGFFVAYSAQSGGIYLDCSVHDIDLARWMLGNPKAQRAFASGTVALHPGLAEHGDVDNGLAIVEFEGGARAVFYATRTLARWMLGNPKAQRAFASGTVALHPGLAEHGDVDNGLAIVEFEGGARAVFYATRTLAHGHETSTEVIGTAGTLEVGHGAARDRVVTRDAHGVRHQSVADFFERFSEAFQREMAAFVAACRGEQPLTLTLSDATEATRIGLAITRSLRSGQVENV